MLEHINEVQRSLNIKKLKIALCYISRFYFRHSEGKRKKFQYFWRTIEGLDRVLLKNEEARVRQY